MKNSDWIWIAVIGGIAYAAYKLVPQVGAEISDATQAAGNAVGGSLFDFLNPNAAGSPITYTAYAPNLGRNIAVNSLNVNSDGTFQYSDGHTYLLQVDPSIVTGINKVATLVS